MKKSLRISLLLTVLLLSLLPLGQAAFAQDELPVVRVVLFYSNSCGHCAKVITQDLPPLLEQYGSQLNILSIETSSPEAQTLFMAAIDYYQLQGNRAGVVPMMIVDDHVLIGSSEIPEQLPGIIEAGLAKGGIDWPAIPGLAEMIEKVGTEPVEHGTESNLPARLTMSERFALDPAGNTVSAIVLGGMLLVVAFIAVNFNRPAKKDTLPFWAIPALAAVGIVVAAYLSFVEVTQTTAVCGPVGDCNAVQQSSYATLFGFLPIGVLGVIGYVLILSAWGIQQYGREDWRSLATQAIWLMAGFGTLFSIYLTYLELFVIGATCMWCITSAIVQTAIFWLATDPFKRLRKKPTSYRKISKRAKRKRTKRIRRKR